MKLIILLLLSASSVMAVQAPRCLDEETYPGVIKHYGEFVITLAPAEKGPKDVTEVTKILNEGDTESSMLDWVYAYDGKGSAFVSATFKAWPYDGARDTDGSFKQRRAVAITKANAALDKIAALPGVSIKCDTFAELNAPRKGALVRLKWAKVSTIRHQLKAASADLIRLLWAKGLNNPLEPAKSIWYDVRNIICKSAFGSGQKEDWTCVVNEYGAPFFTLTGDDAAAVAKLLDNARAGVEDVKNFRTLYANGIFCKAKNLQTNPLKFTDADCTFSEKSE